MNPSFFIYMKNMPSKYKILVGQCLIEGFNEDSCYLC